MADAFPLQLLGNTSIWFNTTPDLADKSYPKMIDALRRQFHSTSDVWLLRQKLNERKQLPTESVTTYAADIRRTCRRIDLPRSEWVNHFIQGLKPGLKAYVMLQQPTTLEEAENYAKLKESAPDPTADKMDQMLSILTKQAQAPTVAAYNPVMSNNPSRSPQGNMIHKTEVMQMIRQELRQTNQSQTNRMPLDGHPICDYCNTVRHIAYACRQRSNQNRDPRIPNYNERSNFNSHPRYSGQSYRPTNQQHLN